MCKSRSSADVQESDATSTCLQLGPLLSKPLESKFRGDASEEFHVILLN